MVESFYSVIKKMVTLKFSTSCKRINIRSGSWNLIFWHFNERKPLLFGEKDLILVFGRSFETNWGVLGAGVLSEEFERNFVVHLYLFIGVSKIILTFDNKHE